jgi:hypothetical protein
MHDNKALSHRNGRILEPQRESSHAQKSIKGAREQIINASIAITEKLWLARDIGQEMVLYPQTGTREISMRWRVIITLSSLHKPLGGKAKITK